MICLLSFVPYNAIKLIIFLHFSSITHNQGSNSGNMSSSFPCTRDNACLFIKLTAEVPRLSYLPLDPRFAGSNLAGVDGFFSDRKNPEYDFLWKGSKVVGPVS